MTHKMIRALAPICLIAFAGPVAAQSVNDDVRCWIAGNVVARAEKDPQKRQLAAVASIYFLGRVDARISLPQLKAAAMAQEKTMNGQTLGTIMTGCAQRFVAQQRALQALAGKPAAPKAK